MTYRGMSRAKNLEIKLFGKTIFFLESCAPATPGELPDVGRQILGKSQLMDVCSQHSEKTQTECKRVHTEDDGNQEKSSVLVNGNKEEKNHTNSKDAQSQPQKSSASLDDHEEDQQLTNWNEVQRKTELKENQTEIDDSDQDKDFEQPDKIIPCPRCNSLETKFCYFNNYNVNQPRHYCKNCQRYWTAGGSMRNVPVGAGRRKNKQLATPCHPLLKTTGGLPSTEVVIPDMVNQQLLSYGESANAFRPPAGQETIPKFGCGGPLHDSMSGVRLRDRNQPHVSPFEQIGKEASLSNSSLTSSIVGESKTAEMAMGQQQGSLPHFWNRYTPHNPQCHLFPDRLPPHNPGWDSSTCFTSSQLSELSYNPYGNKSNLIVGSSSYTSAVPSHFSTSFPLHYLPSPHWNPLPGWAISSGNVSGAGTGTNRGPSPLLSTSNNSLVNNLQSLGKHCRDANTMNEERLEKCLVIPKTLRINELNEASRSSTSDSHLLSDWPNLGKHCRDAYLDEKRLEKFFTIPKTLRINELNEASRTSISEPPESEAKNETQPRSEAQHIETQPRSEAQHVETQPRIGVWKLLKRNDHETDGRPAIQPSPMGLTH